MKEQTAFENFRTLIARFLIPFIFCTHLLTAILISQFVSHETGDSDRYLQLAAALSNGHFSLATDTGLEAEGVRAIGYPAFLYACKSVFGPSIKFIIGVQLFLYLASVFLVFRLIRNRFGDGQASVFPLLLAGYPFVAYYACVISPEMICVFLIASAVAIFDKFYTTDRRALAFVIFSSILSAAVYFRPTLVGLAVFVVIPFVIKSAADRVPALKGCLAGIVILVPAFVYYSTQFGTVSPIPPYAGKSISLWWATVHARVGTAEVLIWTRGGEIGPNMAKSGLLEQMLAANERIGLERSFPINMGYYANNEIRSRVETEFLALAFENIRTYTFSYLGKTATNTVRMWFSFYFSYNVPFPLQIYLMIAGIGIAIFGLIGAILLLIRGEAPHLAWVLIMAMVFHMITLCWFHTEARYTIPVRLFMLAFAAYGVCFMSSQLYARFGTQPELVK